VLELPMGPALPDLVPAIGLNCMDQVANLHRSGRSGGVVDRGSLGSASILTSDSRKPSACFGLRANLRAKAAAVRACSRSPNRQRARASRARSAGSEFSVRKEGSSARRAPFGSFMRSKREARRCWVLLC
jgi:hypothetical protein